ncbi:E3 ubiquitin-protein ligase TRIM56-like [Branchiostoma lanceolatum]|uniref:E3 ubiquitin-protein ligase TRIM56-like n=1 Tax=Branchiostoma lanceolatum TaxID=7740 RepID=UPI00345499A0
MAESKLLSRLSEDFLECQICLQPYRRPKVLSCLHSFFQQCLEEFLKKQEATTELDCPTCRSKTFLPGGEVTKLKDNFFVESLKDTVDVHKKLSNEEAESLLCGSCETKSGAESFCTECGYFLCDECVAIHRRIKAFKGHQVIGLEQLKAESDTLSKIKPRPLPRCRIHPQETLKLYCVDCSEAICQLCTVLSHKEHEYEYFADTAVKAKEDIIAILEKTEKKVGDLKNADQQAHSQKYELEKNVKESVEKIKRKAEQTRRELAALVNQRETELLDSVTTGSQTRSKEFSTAIEEIETATVALESAAEFGRNIVEHGSEFDIMAVSGEVSGRLKKLLQAELADITEGLPAKAYVAFEEDKTSGLAKPHLGEVKTKEFEEKPKFEFAFTFAQPASSEPSPEKEKKQDTSASQTPEPSPAKGYRQQASALQTPATFLKKSQTESHKGFGDLFKTKPGSWDCEVCMVNNPGDKTNCLACSTPKPGTSAAGSTADGGSKNLAALFKPKVDTWDCSVCMVNNPADKTACLA